VALIQEPTDTGDETATYTAAQDKGPRSSTPSHPKAATPATPALAKLHTQPRNAAGLSLQSKQEPVARLHSCNATPADKSAAAAAAHMAPIQPAPHASTACSLAKQHMPVLVRKSTHLLPHCTVKQATHTQSIVFLHARVCKQTCSDAVHLLVKHKKEEPGRSQACCSPWFISVWAAHLHSTPCKTLHPCTQRAGPPGGPIQQHQQLETQRVNRNGRHAGPPCIANPAQAAQAAHPPHPNTRAADTAPYAGVHIVVVAATIHEQKVSTRADKSQGMKCSPYCTSCTISCPHVACLLAHILCCNLPAVPQQPQQQQQPTCHATPAPLTAVQRESSKCLSHSCTCMYVCMLYCTSHILHTDLHVAA
jgi:hypothetical protein